MLPRKILVRAPNWIGDHVMARSFYQALRHLYPSAQLTLLAHPSLSELEPPGVFDELQEIPPNARRPSSAFVAFAKFLRAEAYDLAVNLPTSLSSASLLWLASIPNRVGYSQGGSGAFLTASLPWEGVSARRHKSRLYLELAWFLSGVATEPTLLPPQSNANRSGIVVAPGASIPLREWPGFQELLIGLRSRHPEQAIRLVGAGSDDVWKARLARLELTGIECLVGKTTLLELVEVCRQARLVIANDSGVAHVAASVAGAATVVLFGPGNPVYVQPHGSRVRIVRDAELSCSPCEKPYCAAPYGYQRCLRNITADEVLTQVEQELSL